MATFGAAESVFEALVGVLPAAHAQMSSRVAAFPPAQRIMAQRMLDFVMPILLDMAEKTLKLLQKSHVKQGNNFTDIPLDELFLALELLAKKPLDKVDPNSSEYTAVVAADWLWQYLTTDDSAEDKKPPGTRRNPMAPLSVSVCV